MWLRYACVPRHDLETAQVRRLLDTQLVSVDMSVLIALYDDSLPVTLP